MFHRPWISLWLWVGLALAGCSNGGGGLSIYLRLQDDDPDVRIQAMAQAVESHDPQAVPYLVENLGSGNGDVRLFASLALEKLTGQTMGYEYYASPSQREQAIELWRKWLAGGRKPSATQPSQPAGGTSRPATAGTSTQQAADPVDVGRQSAGGKTQISNPKPQANEKRQTPKDKRTPVGPESVVVCSLGHCRLSFVWDLGFGAWSFAAGCASSGGVA